MEKRKEKSGLIIHMAKETFLENGFFNTVMDDIAEKSGLTRRTLYRYFATKEDLAYEVTIKLINDWNTYQKAVFKDLEGSGIEKLEKFLNYLIDYMSNRMDVMRYLGEFDFYFKDENLFKASTDSITRFNDIILQSDGLLWKIIRLGQEDKSIIKEIDLPLTVATISNVLWSFAQRIAIRGKTIKEESGLEAIDLIRYQVLLYINAIKEV